VAYVPDWERLADALDRVVKAGLPEDEAKRDICNAVADRKIKIRPTINLIDEGPVDKECNHRFAREYGNFVRQYVSGVRILDVPSRLNPDEFNWSESQFKTRWRFEPGWEGFPGPRRFAWIGVELFCADVTKVLIAIDLPPCAEVVVGPRVGNSPGKSSLPSLPESLPPKGRRPKYDWDEVEILVFQLLTARGDYIEKDQVKEWSRQTDLERCIADYFSRQASGEVPAISLIRKKIGPMVQGWRREQARLK
jgi:hypothetical protein